MKNHISGVNYLDTNLRDGTFSTNMPTTAGVEGARLGPGAEGVSVGDRVAYFYVGSGK